VKPTEPLPLFHSWPLLQRPRAFDLGHLMDIALPGLRDLPDDRQLTERGVGWWECELADNSLTWTDGVYDIFGFPRGVDVARNAAVACYASDSRAAMERLRAYAIRFRRGFTLDVQIDPAQGQERRWMRLVAAPICVGDTVVKLRGVKQLL
jgi:hypothetical protein